MCEDDLKIMDIQRVARTLNTNSLSLEEYLQKGGKYSREEIDTEEEGSFGNFCALAGVKAKTNAIPEGQPNTTTVKAMLEAGRMTRDSKSNRFDNIEDLLAGMES